MLFLLLLLFIYMIIVKFDNLVIAKFGNVVIAKFWMMLISGQQTITRFVLARNWAEILLFYIWNK